MPIHRDHIRPPVRLTSRSYVPHGGERYKVTDVDSWITLAARVGMSPWNLIRYNYPDLPDDLKLATKEVNWYLENYVGCTKVVDGRNYAFSTGLTPGQVWLPRVAKPSPTPVSPDEAAKSKVLEVLRHPMMRRINFFLGIGLYVGSSDYEPVADAIESGKIHVKANSSMGSNAQYNSGSNTIMLNPDTASPGLIVHECTHALFDVRKQSITLAEDEGAAYIAQALYSLLRFGPSSRPIVPVTGQPDLLSWVSWQGIFDESRRIAQMAARNPFVAKDELEPLYGWINGADSADHSFYRGKGKQVEQYDGV